MPEFLKDHQDLMCPGHCKDIDCTGSHEVPNSLSGVGAQGSHQSARRKKNQGLVCTQAQTIAGHLLHTAGNVRGSSFRIPPRIKRLQEPGGPAVFPAAPETQMTGSTDVRKHWIVLWQLSGVGANIRAFGAS